MGGAASGLDVVGPHDIGKAGDEGGELGGKLDVNGGVFEVYTVEFVVLHRPEDRLDVLCAQGLVGRISLTTAAVSCPLPTIVGRTRVASSIPARSVAVPVTGPVGYGRVVARCHDLNGTGVRVKGCAVRK